MTSINPINVPRMHMMKNGSRLPANLLFGLGLVLVAALLSSGCKKATVAEPASAAAEIQPAADQAPISNTVVTAAPAVTQPAAGADLGELNRGMIRWIVANRRRPNNFEDFAATANMAIPPPPTGKKYVIDSTMHIQLVNH
jgi:hypothetical protein